MPRSPVLPTINWPTVFESGQEYSAWLASAENPASREKLTAQYDALTLDPATRGFLSALPRAVYAVAIAEAWCGDVVRHAPVLQLLADAAPKFAVRYITREQHPEVFARFLTNGGEAIPKFIFLSEEFVECGNWGPMPDALREIIARGKACGDLGAARRRVSARYQADPECRDVIRELIRLIDVASCLSP